MKRLDDNKRTTQNGITKKQDQMRQLNKIWLIAFTDNVLAFFVFLSWLFQTDFMFGHYSGPIILLILAFVCAVSGIGAGLFWFISGFRNILRRRREVIPMKWKWKSMVQGVVLSILLVFSCLITLISVLEFLGI